jgi:Pro-kumamolisin, activation domain/Bacterial Ig-like domain (group 3)
MRSRLMSRFPLASVLLLTAFLSSAQAAVQNRISGAVNGGSRVPLQGTVVGRAKLAADLGPAPADRQLQSLSLRFSMTSAQQASLTQLLAAQLNPSSGSYHKWLTPEQFGAQFGLSSSDLAKVSSWLTSQGFTITGTARSSTFITFTGTVAQAQQAFGTSIHNLSYNGVQHFSNTTDPVLPSAIASVVNAVTGLNDFRPRAHSRPRSASATAASPLYTQTVGGTTSHYISPADFYTIYDMNSLVGSSLSTSTAGQGFTIAIVGQTDPILGDVSTFRTAAGLPPLTTTNYKTQLYGTDPGNSAADVDESHIDMEWSGAAAPGATIFYAYGVDVFTNALTGAIDNNVAPIISSSYGDCETGIGTATLNSLNQLLQQANAQGITVISSSGDTGAADCDEAGLASEGLAVDFPGSSPFATSAGGTMFSGDVSSPGTYWSSTNGSTGGSALLYIPEQPWNETTATGGLDVGGAGGGGASAFFSKPSWQTGTGAGNTPADSSRDVPDFALNAAANHDGYLVCSSGVTEASGATELACSNGFLNTSGQPNIFGGTSFVAPSFAGILAVIEQKLGGTANVGIGNVGPILYGLANGPTYSSIFHDVTTGNNSIPCSQGTPNCSNADPAYSNGAIGYNAGTGYDQASGLGSLDVNNLATGWKTATPAGVGGSTSVGSVLSTTSVTTSAAACGITGSTFALTVTVASGTTAAPTTYPSLPASSAVPTGMVQILVDNAAVGSPQALVNGVANVSLSTSTITSGGHSISAVYTGDGTFAGSKGSLLTPDPTGFAPSGTLASVDFVSSSKPDFSFTTTGSNPCTGAVSVAPGAVATGVTFTVTPVNGFTGSVNVIATNNNLADVTTNFTVTPITVSSASGVTTSFVITAYTTTPVSSLRPLIQHKPSGRAPWYAAGSGATLACMLLFTLPRRRRWGALLAVILSVAALTAVGCSNTSTTGGGTGGGGGGGGTTPSTPASPGTYVFTVTAVSGALVHSAQVTLTVQ